MDGIKRASYAGMAVVAALLGGCVTPQPLVQVVAANPESHLASSMSETKLSDSVRNAIGIKGPGTVKRKVMMDVVMTNIEGESRKSFEQANTFHVLDNGLVRSAHRVSTNGIAQLTEFSLDYYGVFNLIYQSMAHSATNMNSPTLAKAVARADKGIADPKESTEYVFEYALAPEVQLMNFTNQRTVCKTGKWLQANTMHAKLTGMALPISCEYFRSNGQTFYKRESAFIKDLGIVVPRSSSSTERSRTYEIKDVR